MRLNQITPSLRATNLQRTIDFYTQTLGFNVELLWPDQENPSLAILTHGSARISFFMDDDEPHTPATLTGQLWIDVEDVLALHAQIVDKVEVLWGPEVYSYHRREFAIKDPNGYLLAFSERTTDPPSFPED
jgi:catechol 2,3-dioxygenase-like lactoylglutathione lyase family enzyme